MIYSKDFRRKDLDYSKSFAEACAISGAFMERIFQSSTGGEDCGRLLRSYLGDEYAVFTFKKYLIAKVEDRLMFWSALRRLAQSRGNKISFYSADIMDSILYPLLREKWGDFGVELKSDVFSQTFCRLKWFAEELSWVFFLPLVWLLTPLKRGFTFKEPEGRHPFAMLTHYVPGLFKGRWKNIFFLADGIRIKPDEILAVTLAEDFYKRFRSQNIACAWIGHLKIPPAFWLFDWLPRLSVFAAGILRLGGDSPAARLFKNCSMKIVYHSFTWEMLFQNFKLKVICDFDTVGQPSHAIRASLAKRYGVKTVRLPYSQIDSPGNISSYWNYSVICTSGHYLPENYGQTWVPDSKIEIVGDIGRSDSEGRAEEMASAAVIRKLETLRSKKIITVCTGSHVIEAREIHFKIIRITDKILAEEPEVFAMIKPKAAKIEGHVEFLYQKPCWDILKPWIESGRAMILDPGQDYAATLGYLFQHSKACLAYQGTPTIEAMAYGVPVFSLINPNLAESPLVELWKKVVYYKDPSELFKSLIQCLRDQPFPKPDPELVRHYFDPFGDSLAIERTREVIFNLLKVDGNRS